ITVNLEDVEALQAVRFLAEEYGLSLVQTGDLFRVRLPDPAPAPPPEPLRIAFEHGRLSVDLADADVAEVARRLTEERGTNVVLGPGVSERVSGCLQGADFEDGLRALLERNGFSLHFRDGLFVIAGGYGIAGGEAPEGAPEAAPVRRASLGVAADDSGIF